MRSKVDLFKAQINYTMSLPIFQLPKITRRVVRTTVTALQLAESTPLSTAAGSGIVENNATSGVSLL